MLLSAVGIEERRARDRAVRRRLIVATARRLAEAEGWDAVTTRRLSTEIEYSQPVLYKHFSGMDAVAEAVAIDGFGELADVLSKARSGRRTPKAGTPPQLSAAFAELRDAVSAIPGHHDADTLTEVAWSALHGLVTLTRGGRLRSGHDSVRVELLIDTLCAAP
jgi:AcrR family transcriptional regulator